MGRDYQASSVRIMGREIDTIAAMILAATAGVLSYALVKALIL